ncbi:MULTISPECIES: hypothetical protein [unclassified Sinorhizobium]|uniref:hypothetical protein n=1 Tax=unclassified Sinorhizobium TaxID=2613772 RepID=UPI0035237CA5
MSDNVKRNLHPHAEARLAMALWGAEYAAQLGGSMDFWDGLSEPRKRVCVDILESVLKALDENGRASLRPSEAKEGGRG